MLKRLFSNTYMKAHMISLDLQKVGIVIYLGNLS